MVTVQAGAGEGGFGPLLRHFRGAKRLSQQALAESAEVSTRHVSFLETGKSQPSREMVLVLGNALDLPLRERNRLLGAAGFTPVYRESSLLESPEMAPVRRALDHMLRQQEPYGAFVLDRRWRIRMANEGATRTVAAWMPSDAPAELLGNPMHAVFHPQGLRPFVMDWPLVAGALLARLQREAAEPGGEEAAVLLDELLRYPGVPERAARVDPIRSPSVALTLGLRRPDLEVRLFTTIATLGTPTDVTAQELRIECYYPADEATDAWCRRLAGLSA